MAIRLISHSEINRVMTCQAQHDFAYGDQLVGSSLKPKQIAPRLQEGRAFGAAAAAYHLTGKGIDAIEALDVSLGEDRERQEEFGVFDEVTFIEMRTKLLAVVGHYIDTTDEWRADGVEYELLVPIPSRSGGTSNKYRYLGYVDATRTIEGRLWLVEFKLRSSLSSAEQMQLDRQIRRYSWAWWKESGIKPAGVMVIERLNAHPQPPRLVQGRKRTDPTLVPSHAKDQATTPEAYIDTCSEYDVEPVQATLEALRQRRWQQNFPIQFRDGELEEAGKELVSAAKLIRDLDSGELWPVRHARPQNCRSCAFKEICPAPDPMLVDALFERVPAKRLRKESE